MSAESLSAAGHLLHLAVAGCLFNDILREARNRGIVITKFKVSTSWSLIVPGNYGGGTGRSDSSSTIRPAGKGSSTPRTATAAWL